MNQTETDTDFPVLTDIIDDDEGATPVALQNAGKAETGHTEVTQPGVQARQHLHAALCDKLIRQLSQQIPPLLASALREHLPAAIDTHLQRALIAVLAEALPAATQSASHAVAAQVTSEVGARLQDCLEAEVRRSVAEAVARRDI